MLLDQSFQEAVEEFFTRTAALRDLESTEGWPPPAPSPYSQDGPPVQSPLVLDEDLIRKYALSIGDDNPLYTDPRYGMASVHGAMIAPGPILVLVRYPADHGADRRFGYPVANFVAGVAWEFYDVLRPGTTFTSSKVLREVFEKAGSRHQLIFLVSENLYWDQTTELKAKAYGSLIEIPMEAMASGRAMEREQLGKQMIYATPIATYDARTAERIMRAVTSESRRGPDPLYWEEVGVEQRLPPIVQPPYTLTDMIAYQAMCYGLAAANDRSALVRSFAPAYRRALAQPETVRTHPVTRWPFTNGEWDEHNDALLASYRGQPRPFDFGIQRAQVPQRLLANWMGDGGFLRRMYTSLRRPVFYGDAAWFEGTVIRKQVVAEEGDGERGGVPGRAAYHSVTIAIEGRNQDGEIHTSGFATVYLPSREHGPVRLPIPHGGRPRYVPLAEHRRDTWF
jgi:N-terminal half of MaoC dehydratase